MTELLIRLFVKDGDNAQDAAVHTRYGKMAGWVGIVCNGLLAISKLLAGFFSGSIAIMADAVNNVSDAASSVITLVGFKLAEKPADKEHPFGHARSEYIAGLAVAVMVMVIGIELGRSSIEKIMHPTNVVYSWVSLGVLAGSILLKLWMATFNRNIGRRIGSVSLQATFVDSRNDVITTCAVLAAALVARATGLQLDGWMGMAVAVFILLSGFGLVKDTLNPLLGTAPDKALVQRLKDAISAYPGVLGTHDLLVHDYGPKQRFATVHVEMDSAEDVLKSHEVIDRIEREVGEKEGIRLLIHFDPVPTGEAARKTGYAQVEHEVKAIDQRLTIHDLRVVDRGEYVEYIFDMVAPPELALSDDELRARMEAALQNGEKPVRVRMTVDRSFSPIPR